MGRGRKKLTDVDYRVVTFASFCDPLCGHPVEARKAGRKIGERLRNGEKIKLSFRGVKIFFPIYAEEFIKEAIKTCGAKVYEKNIILSQNFYHKHLSMFYERAHYEILANPPKKRKKDPSLDSYLYRYPGLKRLYP